MCCGPAWVALQLSWGVRHRLLLRVLIRSVLLTTVLTTGALFAPVPVLACSAPWWPPGWRPGRPGPPEAQFYARALLREAETVVWVRAQRFTPGPPARRGAPPEPQPAGRVTFVVREVLKGQTPGLTLTLPGIAVAASEFNPTSVPYRAPRPSAMAGSCFSYQYQLGGEYLLLLKLVPGQGLTPYWAPVAPVNEQLQAAQDPWLRWVRQQLARSRGA